LDDYADEKLAELPANNSAFSVTMPRSLKRELLECWRLCKSFVFQAILRFTNIRIIGNSMVVVWNLCQANVGVLPIFRSQTFGGAREAWPAAVDVYPPKLAQSDRDACTNTCSRNSADRSPSNPSWTAFSLPKVE
jgi:hypothetical protein